MNGKRLLYMSCNVIMTRLDRTEIREERRTCWLRQAEVCLSQSREKEGISPRIGNDGGLEMRQRHTETQTVSSVTISQVHTRLCKFANVLREHEEKMQSLECGVGKDPFVLVVRQP